MRDKGDPRNALARFNNESRSLRPVYKRRPVVTRHFVAPESGDILCSRKHLHDKDVPLVWVFTPEGEFKGARYIGARQLVAMKQMSWAELPKPVRRTLRYFETT